MNHRRRENSDGYKCPLMVGKLNRLHFIHTMRDVEAITKAKRTSMECYGKIAGKHGVRISKRKLHKNAYTLIPFIYDRKISMHVDVQIKTLCQTIPAIISWEELSIKRLRFPYFLYVALFCILFGGCFHGKYVLCLLRESWQ